jgi:predicted DNA-binding transcriptional regulator AlpA
VEGFLTVAQVATRHGVHPGSVYRWLDDPDIPLTKHKTGNGRVWISEAESEAWLAVRNTPVVVEAAADSPAGAGS